MNAAMAGIRPVPTAGPHWDTAYSIKRRANPGTSRAFVESQFRFTKPKVTGSNPVGRAEDPAQRLRSAPVHTIRAPEKGQADGQSFQIRGQRISGPGVLSCTKPKVTGSNPVGRASDLAQRLRSALVLMIRAPGKGQSDGQSFRIRGPGSISSGDLSSTKPKVTGSNPVGRAEAPAQRLRSRSARLIRAPRKGQSDGQSFRIRG